MDVARISIPYRGFRRKSRLGNFVPALGDDLRNGPHRLKKRVALKRFPIRLAQGRDADLVVLAACLLHETDEKRAAVDRREQSFAGTDQVADRGLVQQHSPQAARVREA